MNYFGQRMDCGILLVKYLQGTLPFLYMDPFQSDFAAYGLAL